MLYTLQALLTKACMLCRFRGGLGEPQPEQAATPHDGLGADVLAAVRAAVEGPRLPDKVEAHLTAIRSRVNALGKDEAYASHVAIGSLLASRCAAWHSHCPMKMW